MAPRSKPPAFLYYPGDIDSDEQVRAMSDLEFGFHVRLLGHAWLNNGIPADLERLAAIMTRPVDYVRTLWPALAPCWIQHPTAGDRLVNPGLEAQRAELDERREAAREAANRRWSGSKGSASALPTHSAGNTVAMPVHSGRKARAVPSVCSSFSITSSRKEEPTANAQFDAQAWWNRLLATYPNPTDTDHCCRVFISLVDDEQTAQAVLDGLERWKRSETWAGGYIHSMRRWLEGRMWQDSPKPSADAVEADRPRKKSRVGCDPLAEWVPPWKDDDGNILPEYSAGDPREEAA